MTHRRARGTQESQRPLRVARGLIFPRLCVRNAVGPPAGGAAALFFDLKKSLEGTGPMKLSIRRRAAAAAEHLARTLQEVPTETETTAPPDEMARTLAAFEVGCATMEESVVPAIARMIGNGIAGSNRGPLERAREHLMRVAAAFKLAAEHCGPVEDEEETPDA